MDEPTAALSEREVERLFTVIRRLQEQSVTVIYISHKLDEILTLGDRVTVMRDGKHIATKPMSEVDGRAELIDMMIGRSIMHDYSPRDAITDEVFLAAQRLNNHRLKDVSFDIKKARSLGFMVWLALEKPRLHVRSSVPTKSLAQFASMAKMWVIRHEKPLRRVLPRTRRASYSGLVYQFNHSRKYPRDESAKNV
ncbi:ribose ABC transport system ATP-binding protein RbsA [Vibrio maritimus]|uniref:Ribose ABC transport system ATP-binding protein RbsA n=1 Tax=Vibrio maritimus TaxID=990268 RepID=A0A090S357_9VIBR|nr:ribose ABC transport system ATP-binding protein RbsA [Vibrio maritimus]